MKRSLILSLPILMLVMSCGTFAEYSSQQRYADGIYTRYAAAEAAPKPLYTVEDFDAMARRNIAAKQEAAATARDTVYVVLQDNRYDYAWNAWWVAPWMVFYGFYNPWYYDPWYYDPWYYRPYYRPYYPHHYGYRPAPRHSNGPQFGGGHGIHSGAVSGRPASYTGSSYSGSLSRSYGASGTSSFTGGSGRATSSGSSSGSRSSGSSITHSRGYNYDASSSRSSSSSSSSSYSRSYNPSSSSSYSSGSSSRSYGGGSSYSGGGYGGGGSHSGGGSSRGGGRR